MSVAIRFLEMLGGGPALGVQSGRYAKHVADLDIEGAQKQALLTCDHDALNGLLGARAQMMLQVWAPDEEDMPQRENDQPLPDDGEGQQPPDESPDR